VEEQQRLIQLLKEKRQVVISSAVTRGLDANAPMKDSGVEWLGKVPKHWTLKRLKWISPFIAVGIVVNPSDFVADEGLPFIYGGDISEGRIDTEHARRISSDDSERNAKMRLSAGDLVTVRVGAPGVTAVVPASCEGGNCASVMLTRKGDYCSQWLCYVMNSRTVRYQVELVQYGAAQEQFNISHAVNFFVPTPPRDEQVTISAYLDAEVANIDALVSEGNASITLLQERRAALISAAVTGKIDVSGLLGADAPVPEVVAA
jgi:type I restriction enzyme, S subunit